MSTSSSHLPPAGKGTHRTVAVVSSLITRFFDRLGSFGKFEPPDGGGSAPLSSTDLALQRTEMATLRSLMAADRTLMAWVRTALSMVSFGFTIYKILQGFAESGTALGAVAQPRVVALVLIGLGDLSIIFGALEYWETARGLARTRAIPIWRPSFTMAVIIAVLSVLLFFAVIFKAL